MSDEVIPTYPDPHPVHGPRPDLYMDVGTIGGEVWSNSSIGDVRLTWREVAEDERGRARRQAALVKVLYDLDRCEHGRHEGDTCSGPHPRGCGGTSRGNPFVFTRGDDLQQFWERLTWADQHGGRAPRQIGFTIDGHPIVVPATGIQKVADAYRAGRG